MRPPCASLIAFGKPPSWLRYIWFLLLVLAAGASNAKAPIPASIEDRVVAIVDGDTIDVLDATQRQHRIRLASIDAPEKRQAFRRVRVPTGNLGPYIGPELPYLGDSPAGLGGTRQGLALHAVEVPWERRVAA